MIIKLHGTSGSGKTTVARGLMAKANAVDKIKVDEIDRNRPAAYRLIMPNLMNPIYILGPYETTCGGLDSLSDADDHIWLLNHFGDQGHVFYEGLLQSGFYGRIGEASEKWGDDHVFAFLDTPLDTCLDRVKKRRIERGTTTEFNPDNTIDKFNAIIRLKYRLDNGVKCPKRKTVYIRHINAVGQVMELYDASES